MIFTLYFVSSFILFLFLAAIVGLEETHYVDTESIGSILVCAAILAPRNCSIAFPFTLIFSTSDDSAGTDLNTTCRRLLTILFSSSPESPSDFISISDKMIVFQPSQTRSCVNVLIRDDGTVEQLETFGVSLNRAPDLDERVILTQTSGFVDIFDDDGKLKQY